MALIWRHELGQLQPEVARRVVSSERCAQVVVRSGQLKAPHDGDVVAQALVEEAKMRASGVEGVDADGIYTDGRHARQVALPYASILLCKKVEGSVSGWEGANGNR